MQHSNHQSAPSPQRNNKQQFFTSPLVWQIYLKQGLIGLALAMLGVCLSMFVLEAIARLLPPPYEFDEYDTDVHMLNYLTCDRVLGWIGQPNFRGVIQDSAFRQKISANSLGMHDTEHPLEKPAHTYRILMLGDSFVQALQVAETQTMHQVLEDDLNARRSVASPRFEVLSAGVLGWGTGQQLIYYREHGRAFEPDLVLLMFFIGNDFKDNLPGNVATVRGFNCYAPYFVVCNGGVNPDPLTYAPGISRLQNNCTPGRRVLIKAMGWLYQRSRLYQQLDPLIVSNYPRQVFGHGLVTPLLALYRPNTQPELEQAWQVTLGTIGQLHREVVADARQFVAVVISPAEVYNLRVRTEAELEAIVHQNPYLANVDVNRPDARLAEFFSAQGIDAVDLIDPLLEQRQEGDRLYLQGDRHWTVAGNRVVADVLARWLAENEVVPVK